MSKYIDAELLRKEILEHKEKTPSGFDRHNEIVQILAILDRQPDVGADGLHPTLPCKIGDTVYPKPSFGHTAPEKVTGIYIYEHFAAIKTTRDSFDFKDFGKKVFLTREAAMASVKEINVDPVTPIEDMGFSVRTYNCLKRAMVNTLQDLSERTVEDFQSVRNLGVKSLNEIIDRCKEYGVDIIAKELENNE